MTEDANAKAIQQYLTLLRAQIRYVDGLEAWANEIANNFPSGDAYDLEIRAAATVQWLIEKFDAFWMKTTATEAFLLETIDYVPTFTPLEFEILVKHLLYLFEERIYSITQRSHDEGIDLICETVEDPHYHATSKTIVQCKLYQGSVPISDIRDFFGVMVAHTATGLFITTGNLTAQANTFLPLAGRSAFANKLYIIDRHSVPQLLNFGRELSSIILDPATNENEADEKDAKAVSLRIKALALIRAIRFSSVQGSLF